MQAFVVRPFGTRNGIDFDAVHATLIGPALVQADIAGGTTGLIFEAGNIRDSMFQLLLLAHLVIADISIHNANVFYELGIRHALRGRQTFLIRAKVTKPRGERGPEDEVPFDLKTDRYLQYDPMNPKASLDDLVRGLNDTKNSITIDSPVFRSLPKLVEPDRSQLIPVPPFFADDVRYAADHDQAGKLGLLAWEAQPYSWEEGGVRLVGRELFNCKSWELARETWERVRVTEPYDFEANWLLATIYQKVGDLKRSDLCIDRALSNGNASPRQRAELFALRGSNSKTRARGKWKGLDGEARVASAIEAGGLLESAEHYRKGFEVDLNQYYPGLNALSIYTLLLKLIEAHEDIWLGTFPGTDEALKARSQIAAWHARLAAAVDLALNAAAARLGSGETDAWLAISRADFEFLTSSRDAYVVSLYKRAVAKLPRFHQASAAAQLELFSEFGILRDRAKLGLAQFDPEEKISWKHAIIFTGHMIDAPGREKPRFPASAENAAREAIRREVLRLKDASPGPALGIAGGASGGDILFHEVCHDLGIETRLRLTLPPDRFVAKSVAPAGPEWVKRFHALLARVGEKNVQVLGESEELPRWMNDGKDYNVWQRTNLWILYDAIATGAPHKSLVALWDGKPGDGPGGTQHLVETAPKYGVSVAPIYIGAILRRIEPRSELLLP